MGDMKTGAEVVNTCIRFEKNGTSSKTLTNGSRAAGQCNHRRGSGGAIYLR